MKRLAALLLSLLLCLTALAPPARAADGGVSDPPPITGGEPLDPDGPEKPDKPDRPGKPDKPGIRPMDDMPLPKDEGF